MLGLAAYGVYPRAEMERWRPSLWLGHENPSAAIAARAANPQSYGLLRADDGRDWEQPTSGNPAESAAWWVREKVRPKLGLVPPGTYNCVIAYNEQWPGGEDDAANAFRGALELETCRIVQRPVSEGGLGLDYAWGGIAVGNLEPRMLWRYAGVIREARWTAYHAYLKPGRKLAAEETEPWWAWRPLDRWLLELKRLGLPLRLLLTETGTYSPPEETGISRGEMLAQCVILDRLYTERCKAVGVEHGDGFPFGFGTAGQMDVWNLAGHEAGVDWSQFWGPASGPVDTPAPQPAPAAGEKMKLWLAIIPSNQDANPVLGGGNEMVQMAVFAARVLAAARVYAALDARVFTGKPESSDTYRFQRLREQIQQAYAWLDTAPAGTLTLGLHLHSDSGTFSHVGAYWGNADITQRLALSLRAALASSMSIANTLGQNYESQGYLAWSLANGRHCPVILECGSHQVAEDIRRLRDDGPKIATALTEAIRSFFGLSADRTAPAVPVASLNWQEVGEFARWSLARCANREDPRDLAAFATHLKALGAAWADPYRYGYPVR